MSEKAKNTLGLCQRAGKAVSGDFLIKELLTKGKEKAYLLLVAEDAAAKTKQEASFRAKKYSLELIERGSKEELGLALGKNERSMVVITDQGLASLLKKNLDDEL